MKNTERTILHCDMNNFYASCECMQDMSLRSKPIAVCGSVEERHGIVLAKNYKAKAFGVSTGEAVWQAKQKCKDLVIVEPHYDLYMKYSKLAKEIYADYTDQIEPYGMDECWLDVTGSTKVMGDGETIANDIRERMKFELGLTISAGVSFNKIFAKLGSDMKKPDAVTCLPKESFREKIWGLPASDMLGVGRSTEKKLTMYGIHTIGQIANMPEQYLTSWFGKWGSYLWQYANGLDLSPVMKADYEIPAKSVGHGTTTLQDLENSSEVWPVILQLCQDIGETLRSYAKKAAGISLTVRDNDLFTKQWQYKLPSPTQSASYIAKQAFELFGRSYRWDKPIRSLTVTAISLISQSIPDQLTLFSDTETINKSEKLDACVSDLRRRFGKSCVMPAILLQNNKLSSLSETKLTMPTGMVGA